MMAGGGRVGFLGVTGGRGRPLLAPLPEGYDNKVARVYVGVSGREDDD